jgi:hypothetical protein
LTFLVNHFILYFALSERKTARCSLTGVNLPPKGEANMVKSKVFLVARLSNDVDMGFVKIHERHGTNARIELVRSSGVFTPKGLTTLIQQNKNTGMVYVFRSAESSAAIDEAHKMGLTFGVIEKNTPISILNEPPPYPGIHCPL